MPHHCQGYASPKATILRHHPCPLHPGQNPVRQTLPPSVPKHCGLLVGEDLEGLLPRVPGTQKGKQGRLLPLPEAHTRRALGSCSGGEQAGRASATLPPQFGWFGPPSQHSTLPPAHRLSSPSSQLPSHVPSPPGADWPPQTCTHCTKKWEQEPPYSPALSRCARQAEALVFLENRVGRKVQSETFPSFLYLPGLPEHLAAGPRGETGNLGPSCPGTASCLLQQGPSFSLCPA